LDFFTLLSSISGVVGQKGQANYAAGNAFQDSFARFRVAQGLAATAVDLGVIEDVGYISERKEIAARLDINIWGGIREGHLHRIVGAAIFSDTDHAHENQTESKTPQIITGIPHPQPPSAPLLHDPRFHPLAQPTTDPTSPSNTNKDADSPIPALLALISSDASPAEKLAATVSVINAHFMKTLGLAEPMEPARPLAVYGLDSLAAVDFRSWLRGELKVTVGMLEVVGAKSLSQLCERILGKVVAAREG
ncbi:KR-domain-containing protein, partial [Aspergillus ellipticus CBS 707.79]